MAKENSDLDNDLSIEDILKSIKGIINHNDLETSSPAGTDDILELTNIAGSSYDGPPTTNSLVSSKSAIEVAATLDQFTKQVNGSSQTTVKVAPPTVEALVVELMRPQLKKWLDDNLPSLVKQLVAREIKRLMPSD